MIMVGCDLHTRKQQVARLNTDTGEVRDHERSHDGPSNASMPRCRHP